MNERDALGDRLAELRRTFDGAFAEPPRAIAIEQEDLLRIGVGGDAYAVRLREVAGLFVDRAIVPLPSRSPELFGLAGLKGGIVPVYDLGALLGYPASPEPPRWLLMARHEMDVGFGIEEFRSYLRVPLSSFSQVSEGTARTAHVLELVRAGDSLVPVLSLRSLAESIAERAGAIDTHKG